MATNRSLYPWYPNQAAVGVHLVNDPFVATQYAQFQNGQYSFLPAITAPGTVASAGTVQNSTGADCLVYMSATNGIGSFKVLSYNGATSTSFAPTGSLAAGQMASVLVPGPGAIEVTYAGTLTWTWQPK